MSDVLDQDQQKTSILKKRIHKTEIKTQHSKKRQNDLKNQTNNNNHSQIKKDSIEDILHQISFEKCKPEYLNDMINLLAETFIQQEPICKNSDLKYEDLHEIIRQISEIGIDTSSVAIRKYTDSNEKQITQIISAMVSCDQKDLLSIEEQLNLNKVPILDVIMNIFSLTSNKCEELKGINLHKAKQGEVFHQVFLGTSKDYQKMGIGFVLGLHNAHLAQIKNYKYAIMELTSKFSLSLCQQSNVGQILHSVKYKQLKELELFSTGLSQMDDNALEEKLSIYFADINDFNFSKYQSYVQDLNYII